MKRLISVIALAAVLSCTWAFGQAPKYEFRGAWMHIIGQGQYARMGSVETQEYLKNQLDLLKRAGCNAVVWQIRPQADAAYYSNLEPWTRWLTGKPGVAPDPIWDPLQFMVTECHKRGIELHAWINPYRVTSGKDDRPAEGHIYYEHPEWFLNYADGKIYFDPGLPESRDFIDLVVRDIMKGYDIDAIHMDDYFYPYPVKGAEFPDTASFARYGKGWGDIGEWRRHNVDMLIEQLHNSIADVKPWVRFGISPFGIWRNKKSDSNGSNTNGLQCYDALYADCPRWTAMGWVDYMTPQLYWELEHKAASCLELSKWWDQHANGRHMYFGLSVKNLMDHKDVADWNGDTLNTTQLDHRMRINRELENVHGITWWPGYVVTDNYKGVLDSLSTNHMVTKAIVPPYTWLDDVAPDAVKDLKVSEIKEKKSKTRKWEVTWNAPVTDDPMQEAHMYVVYRFKGDEPVDISRAEAIAEIQDARSYTLTTSKKERCKIAVTVLDRCNNESEPIVVEVK
ncbi:MAG: family 10 glycosylhydrolase [Muribaculaceae bacterium]|nr:family 10 glycosylhydrolase [Muribaculaceae bacterium]